MASLPLRAPPPQEPVAPAAAQVDSPESASEPPESAFIPADQLTRNTTGGEFVIIERIPGEAYEARLGERVVFQTNFAYVVDHPDERRELPGIVPRIIGAFLGIPPFDEVLVLSWFDFGNLCSTHGYSFIGIHRDGTFEITSLSTCTEAEPTLDSDTKRVRLIIPPQPPGIRHGAINPLLPGEEWIFMSGKLKRTRRIYKL